MNKLIEIFIVALKLGVTSFGGPIAHLGYFRDEYVVRRKWLSESLYQDIVSLCQILPGPKIKSGRYGDWVITRWHSWSSCSIFRIYVTFCHCVNIHCVIIYTYGNATWIYERIDARCSCSCSACTHRNGKEGAE